MIYKIPKPPKDGYNILWRSDSKKETSHMNCFLVAAHITGRFNYKDVGHLYLEQSYSNGEIKSWTRISE